MTCSTCSSKYLHLASVRMEDVSDQTQENINISHFSGHTLDKATKAKLTLENYYSNLVSQHKERRQRWERLEETLKDQAIPEDQR